MSVKKKSPGVGLLNFEFRLEQSIFFFILELILSMFDVDRNITEPKFT